MRKSETVPNTSHARAFWILLFIAVSSVAEGQTPQFVVTGGDDQLISNIRSLVSFPTESCNVPPARLTRQLPAIRQQIVRAGRALGYYYLRHNARFEFKESCWNMIIDVIPGDPILVGDIHIQIQEHEMLFSSLLADLPLTTGDQLNQSNYERVKTDLSALAIELGFFEARFENAQLKLDLARNLADVAIDFSPGQRYRIGEIEQPELLALSSEFISRLMGVEPDEYYDSSRLLELRNVLNRSLYFSDVSVTPELSLAEGGRIPIELGLQMRPQQAFSSGVGATTDVGPRIRLNYENRYINREGHSLSAKTTASPIQQDLDIRYRIPLAKPDTESLIFSGGFLSENTESFDNDILRLSAIYSFLNRFDWRQNISLSYQHDDYHINDQHEVSDLLIPGISINRTKANDALYPTNGWRAFAQIRGASDGLLAPESFFQLNLTGKYIASVGFGRLLFKGELGSSLVSDVIDLPVSVRYFGGGDQSVRGYEYQSLGPLNELGEVTGGKHLLSAGVEYDFPISTNWKMAVFMDAGNAFNNFSDYDLKKSVGIGMRWLSPIGPIRVDLASALDNEDKYRIHITMGPDL